MNKSGLSAKVPPNPATGIIMPQSGQQRKIYYNLTWEYYKNYTKEQLAKPELKALYGRRKPEVESVFGNLKGKAYHRVPVRGQAKVHNEVGMILIALNLKKRARAQDLFSDFHLRQQKSTWQKLQDLLPSTYFLVRTEFCPNPFYFIKQLQDYTNRRMIFCFKEQ